MKAAFEKERQELQKIINEKVKSEQQLKAQVDELAKKVTAVCGSMHA